MSEGELARYRSEGTTRGQEVRADLELRAVERQASYALSAELLAEYGRFIAGLTDWTHFVTLTHDPRRLSPGHTLVGRQRHRRQVGAWVRYDLRALAPEARWWSEMELHRSGQAHEHGLLAIASTSPLLSARQRWFERCGYADIIAIRDGQGAAEYVAKYTGKAQAVEPLIAGFGLLRVASFSQLLR